MKMSLLPCLQWHVKFAFPLDCQSNVTLSLAAFTVTETWWLFSTAGTHIEIYSLNVLLTLCWKGTNICFLNSDYAMIFYIWLFGFCTWNLKKLKHLYLCSVYLFVLFTRFSNRAHGSNLHRGPANPSYGPKITGSEWDQKRT